MLTNIPRIRHLDSDQFFLIAGPCAVESRDLMLTTAEQLRVLSDRYRIPFIFKASYRKANRSRVDSFGGIGDEKALRLLEEVGNQFELPLTTDIHTEEEAELAAAVVDILQIPAFLCRQTRLLVAAGATGKVVNIKKGQFMSPGAMGYACDKVKSAGDGGVMLTERGTTFGYADLIVDFRSIPQMQAFEVPVILDCTHSLQQPNQHSGVTGGQPSMIGTIARAGIAVGADGLFIETHPTPSEALSDGQNMLPLDQLEPLLQKLCRIRQATIS